MRKAGNKRNQNSKAVWAGAAFLGWGQLWFLPAALNLKGGELGYTNSALVFLLWLLLTGLLRRILLHSFEGGWKRWLLPVFWSLLFSISMTFGASLDQRGSVTFTDGWMWLSIAGLTLCFGLELRYAWDLLLAYGRKRNGAAASFAAEHKKGEGRALFFRAAVIFLCYLPVFLAVYPGFFVYDAQDELMQVVTRNFSTHHPLVHVLFMGGMVQLGYKLSGSYNVGIACYTLIQMAVLSLILSFCVHRLKKEGMGRAGRMAVTAYFGLFPVIVMFSLCSAKDGLFTGMLLLMLLLLRELFREPEAFFQKKFQAALLFLSSLGMMLLRHNGFYAFLAFGILLFGICKIAAAKAGGKREKEQRAGEKKVWLQTAALFAGVILTYLLLNKGLAAVFLADASENQEMLTVPIQQLARVYQTEKDSLSLEEQEALYEILPEEALNRYAPKVSDGVKVQFNNEAFDKNPGRYGKLWLTLGLRHPFTYLNAWLMTSYGFWYPDTVIDVYRGNSVFTFTYEDSSYFGFEVEEPGVRESRLPWLMELYRKLSLTVFQQKLPVLSMAFSPGFLFWVFAFCMGLFLYERACRKAAPYLLFFLLWLTVLLGPTYLVRYVVFWWFILPVLLFDVWKKLCYT